MATAIALTFVAASFLVALALRVHTKAHWFTAWLIGALVLPVAMWISETFYPSGWLGVALFFGAPVSAGVAALGVFFGWLLIRKRENLRPNSAFLSDASSSLRCACGAAKRERKDFPAAAMAAVMTIEGRTASL